MTDSRTQRPAESPFRGGEDRERILSYRDAAEIKIRLPSLRITFLSVDWRFVVVQGALTALPHLLQCGQEFLQRYDK